MYIYDSVYSVNYYKFVNFDVENIVFSVFSQLLQIR